MKKMTIAATLCALALVGCKPATQKQDVAPQPKGEQTNEVTKGSIAGDYMVYEEGVIGNGESAVLFFYAAWCPFCQEKDNSLRQWYTEAEFPMKVYRVDFDTEMELRQKYGIVQQDSFVLINASGEAVTTEVSPSLTQLKRLLYANLEAAKAMEGAMNGSDNAIDYEDTVVMEETEEEHGGWTDQADDSGTYGLYVDGAIGNGMESVLFFHAAWCPYCIENDKRLTALYGAEEFPRSVYRIDYDTATELKQMFGVTQQDTFILIDGNGNEIRRVSFPSESALRDLLG